MTRGNVKDHFDSPRPPIASADVAEGTTSDRLPRGPHGLSRSEVQESQRNRMITAMIDAVADKGYVRATVGDVLAGAGVSRATFYEQFTDKADCFSATYESVIDLLTRMMNAGIETLDEAGTASDPIDRIDTMVGWYLDLIARAPGVAKVFLVEVYAAGPAAIEQRRRTLEGFVEQILGMLEGTSLRGTATEQRFNVRAMVTSLIALATESVAAGESDRVTELREPFRGLLTHMLLPTS